MTLTRFLLFGKLTVLGYAESLGKLLRADCRVIRAINDNDIIHADTENCCENHEMRCDREACERATKMHSTNIYRYHAGLTEAVTPLYVGDVLVGYLLSGHVFSYADHEAGWAVVDHCTADLPVNRRMLKEAIDEAQPIKEAYVRSAAQILHAVASYLILERMATLKEDLLPAQLDAYLSAHFTERSNAVSVSEHLGIGKTQLYELSQEIYDCGIAEHIRNLRMEKAKTLLRERKDLTLAEVAAQCGYGDYNYFITVFSREVGHSPTS